MIAEVIGATGAVGHSLIDCMMRDSTWDRTDIFVRRPSGLSGRGIREHVVDFEHPADWHEQLQGDVLFSCMGTTLKAAGSKEAQWRVDHDYQLEAAKSALKNGISTLVLVSSMSAAPKSPFFYMKMKGVLEEKVLSMGFEHTYILRPSSLIRKGTDRLNEKLSVPVIQMINRLGLLKTMAPMDTALVAKVMLFCAVNKPAQTIWEAQDIRNLANPS